MNRKLSHPFILIAILSLVVAIASAATGKAVRPGASGSKNAPNFQRTKSRIDALLGSRLKPEPLPETVPNPFQLAELPVANPGDKDPKPVEKIPVSSDEEMLLYYGASLKISGVVRINDQTHLVINQAPYKVGDTVGLKTKDGTVKLRVLGISPGELTLGLNDAVQIVKFKK